METEPAYITPLEPPLRIYLAHNFMSKNRLTIRNILLKRMFHVWDFHGTPNGQQIEPGFLKRPRDSDLMTKWAQVIFRAIHDCDCVVVEEPSDHYTSLEAGYAMALGKPIFRIVTGLVVASIYNAFEWRVENPVEFDFHNAIRIFNETEPEYRIPRLHELLALTKPTDDVFKELMP